MSILTESTIKQITSLAGNDKCFECFSYNPQWASVNNGILICLNCSGIHRSFGVHISFVQSLTMDFWSEKYLNMMMSGGNQKFLDFLLQHEEYSPEMTIKEKYHTRAAHLWRDKLSVESKGEVWNESLSPAMNVPLFVHQKVQKNSDSNFFNNRIEGFGSLREEWNNRIFPEASSSFTRGWNILSSAAVRFASVAGEKISQTSQELNDNVLVPTTQRIRESTLGCQ
ncbi:ADP-ribosylation factor GTPase-activating protein 1-like isoform X1 [Zophobas morio]|uniref:ADP-ribosylation factor GTPase-activating protein 1-like isoform X1 n=2 Tax=Zophobas morio TaxID=2755281 RepID=UPI0030829419